MWRELMTGMAEINISIDEAFETARMNVSVVARDEVDGNGNPLYQVIAITERDKDVLGEFWNLAKSNFISHLRTMKFSTTTEGFDFTLPNIDAGKLQNASMIAQTYFSDFLTGSWLRLKGSSMADTFMSSATVSLDNLKKLLFNREAPVKKLYGEGEPPKEQNEDV